MIYNDWLIIFLSFVLAYWLFLLIAAIGRLVLRFFQLRFNQASERIVFSVTFGLVIVWSVLFFIGFLQLFTWQIILSLLIATTLLIYKEILLMLTDFFRFFKKLPLFWRVFLIIFILFISLAAITLPHHSEELSYYLTIPKIYAASGGIVNIPNLWLSYFHSNIQLLTTIAFIFTGYPLAKILIVLINALVPLAIYVFARRFFGSKVGLISALIFAGLPFYALYQDLLAVDLVTTLFIVAALYLVFLFLYNQAPQKILPRTTKSPLPKRGDEWENSSKDIPQNHGRKPVVRRLLAAGILLGTALSIKLSAGFFIFSCFIVISIIVFFHQDKLLKKLILLSVFALIILTFSAPWLIFNWLYTDNPFFPFWGEATAGWKVVGAIPAQPLKFLHIIFLPWLVSMHSFLGISFLIFLPFIFMVKNWPKGIKLLLLISLTTYFLYLLFVKDWSIISFFYFNDFVRYNLGVWALLCPLVSLVILSFWQNKNVLLKSAIVVFLIIYLGFWGGIQLTARLPKVIWLLQQKQPLANYQNFINTILPKYPSFVTQYNYFHPAVNYLNSLTSSNVRVLTVDARIFYLEKPILVMHGFKELPTWNSFNPPELFIKRLKDFKITHVISPNYQEWYTENMINFLNENQKLIDNGTFKEVFRWPDGIIYQFTPLDIKDI